jgi:LAO/AO transport system kinase
MPTSPNWSPPVITISGLENIGLEDLWGKIEDHRQTLTKTGEFATRRQAQAVKWMHDMLEDQLKSALRDNAQIAALLPKIESRVREDKLTPTLAVEEIIGLMDPHENKTN